MSKNEIAILDFGSQYTHLIARRVRELGVASRIYPNDVLAEKLSGAWGIILSGGPKSIVRDAKLDFDEKIFNLGAPVLGLCYGHQLMADFFSGEVVSGKTREYGLAEIKIFSSIIFEDIAEENTVWMSHGDSVSELPADFKIIAESGGAVAAMANENKNFYGFQFHPEVAHTEEGKKMISNFIFKICRAKKNWETADVLRDIQNEIRKQAEGKKVFMLLSGGVDSTVAFALLEKTLGKDRIFGLHIDHGLMRYRESERVGEALRQAGIGNLHIYNGEADYLKALSGVIDPEEKRKIIGNLFLDIAERMIAEKAGSGDWLLGQGTIYPDTIESGGTKNADKIKTHHNRVSRVQEMIAAGRVIEPFKDLYKDEVREIGMLLGLPAELVLRHPFPGPGLGIRCLCSDGFGGAAEKILSRPYFRIYKLPIKSVGVQGDERSYKEPALICGLRGWKAFSDISPKITNGCKGINRVLFLAGGDEEKISVSKMGAAALTKERLDLLRRIDEIVSQEILGAPGCEKIWQMPVVLVPFGWRSGKSVVLRPVESEEAMTVSFAKIPQNILERIIQRIKALREIDFIFYDITNKPPGTIEWE